MLKAVTGFDAICDAAELRRAGRIRRPGGDPAVTTPSRGDAHRNICLIPKSAHGTNPATAQML